MKILISVLVGWVWLLNGAPALARDTRVGPLVGRYVAADPNAPTVTPENLHDNDVFWPFRVLLKQDYVRAGEGITLLAGPGVLVRVNRNGTARVDFASTGVFDVPIELTDLVESSNRVRRGEESKMAPNLVLTIGNKLLDPTGDRIHVFHIPRDSSVAALLCVYADPASTEFSNLTDALAGFVGRSDLQTVVIPRTLLHDLRTWKRFREVGFRAPFLRERYREPLLRSLLPDDLAERLPYLQLTTKDGRILAEGRFQGAVPKAIESALVRVEGPVVPH